MTADYVLLGGGPFLVTDSAGDVCGDGHRGLFLRDTRHLSRWVLAVDGARPRLLTSRRTAHTARAVLIPPGVRRGIPASYTLFRTQVVDVSGLTEEVRVVNHGAEVLTVDVSYLVGADFADQFELRTDRTYDKPGHRRTTAVSADGLSFRYQRDGFSRRTVVAADPPPALGFPVDTEPRAAETVGTSHPRPSSADAPARTPDGDHQLSWRLSLPPGGEATVRIGVGEYPVAPRSAGSVAAAADETRSFLATAETSVAPTGAFTRPHREDGQHTGELVRCVSQGLTDLAALRIPAPCRPELRVVGAGVPWFLTLFGRDSLLTSLFALCHVPELAADTLRALADLQGGDVDPLRMEEPGKIVHEVREGELSTLGQVPYGRYYGTVDATPLFLVVLSEHRRITGDDALAKELEPSARAAVDWMFHHGGLDDEGYLLYPTDRPGLVNHGWKDSSRAICFRSGEPADGPIGVCEAQGYAYDALRRTAALAREVWADDRYADWLAVAASRLRERFLADFWLDDDGFVALALDGQRRQVDALASNAGHLLWSGVLDPARALAVGRRLTDASFFSGWGIRTLAAGQPAYHPMSYHNGSVWPHDTAICATGMARYGMRAEASMVASGLLAAAGHHGHRLPEVIAGFSRDEYDAPIPYPHSASPQAWAAATPLLLDTMFCS